MHPIQLYYELPDGTKLPVFLNEVTDYDTNGCRGLTVEVEIAGIIAINVGWKYSRFGGKLWPATGKKGPMSTDDEFLKKVLAMVLGMLDRPFRAWLRERLAELYAALESGSAERSEEDVGRAATAEVPTGDALTSAREQSKSAPQKERRIGPDRRREGQVIDLDGERARRVAEPDSDGSDAESACPTELGAGDGEAGSEAAHG
ncbi:MAG TPA: hypothetical protein VME66_05760 [Candidatus Acidoferrales bacterium]|nr:hypothetical protein [Candidatus Acidoferrales bacterium]